MSINLETNQTPAGVDAAPPEPVLTPEEVVDLLRATRAKIGEVAPMTARQPDHSVFPTPAEACHLSRRGVEGASQLCAIGIAPVDREPGNGRTWTEGEPKQALRPWCGHLGRRCVRAVSPRYSPWPPSLSA